MGNSGNQLSAKAIMEVGFGFWPSKILLSAVGFGLFTLLAKNKKMGLKQIATALEFKCSTRQLCDYLDVLVTLGFLTRQGILQSSLYSNSPNADQFLDKQKSTYVGGILEMLNLRLYNMWGTLETSLKTGLPHFQNFSGGVNAFTEIYKHPEMLGSFVHAMTAMQASCNQQFAAKFDFSNYSTLVDAGGAEAGLCTEVAKKNPHMKCTSFDLPPVEQFAKYNIEKLGLSDKVSTKCGDFFKEDLPKADVVTMGLILHDWNMEEKKLLIKRAFEAVNAGGAFVAIESLIDEQRKQHLFGLSMSVNMLIETPGGFDYSFSEFSEWTKAAGFKETKLIQLDELKYAAVAYK